VKRPSVLVGVSTLPWLFFFGLFYSSSGIAQEASPDRLGISAGFSTNFHPSTTVRMIFLSPYLSHDFGGGWRGRLETFLGMAIEPEQRAALGLTPMVEYDLKAFSWPDWFVEGGLGFFYTDVDVPGFGSPLVFSPQAGIGRTFKTDAGRTFSVRLRYHHLSNAYLAKENTSIDSLLLMIGMDFGR
jgi:Lipid A 3-O-deacylase (PagL)